MDPPRLITRTQLQGGEAIRPRPPISLLQKYERCQNTAPCKYGKTCTFAHSEKELHDWFERRVKEEPRLRPSKGARPPYQMCKNVEDNGYCPHDVQCNFSHSKEELEAWTSTIKESEGMPIRQRPKIKPSAHYDICKNTAPCPNGADCTFAHSEEELHHWFQSRVKDEPRLQPSEGARPPYQMCKDAENFGYCSYDVHCIHPHSQEELEAWRSTIQEGEEMPSQPRRRPEIHPSAHYDVCKNKAPCPNGVDCTFAHSEEELHHWFQSRVKEQPRQRPSKVARPPYQMCENAEVNGYCRHDVHCHFAHSKEELEAWTSTIQESEELHIRPRPEIQPFTCYDVCKNKAPCPNGVDCTFAHSEEELHHWFQSRVKEQPRQRPSKGANPPYQMCKNFEDTGYCSYDVNCNYYHSKEELEAWTSIIQEIEAVPIRTRPTINPLAPYGICTNKAPCQFGPHCTFAHSGDELRDWIQSRVKEEPRPDPPAWVEPVYKMCMNVEKNGYCPYDVRCNCPHSKVELDSWLAGRPQLHASAVSQQNNDANHPAQYTHDTEQRTQSQFATEVLQSQLPKESQKQIGHQPELHSTIDSKEVSDAAIFQQRPTVRLFAKLVAPDIIHDWRQFGIFLGVPYPTLQTIFTEEKSAKDACSKMFNEWLSHGSKCSWKKVFEAVEDSCGRGISEGIEQKLIQHLGQLIKQPVHKQECVSLVQFRIEEYEKKAGTGDRSTERPKPIREATGVVLPRTLPAERDDRRKEKPMKENFDSTNLAIVGATVGPKTDEHEYKALLDAAKCTKKADVLDMVARHKKEINAMLNHPDGGTVHFGIQDTGNIVEEGLDTDRYTLIDDLKAQVGQMVSSFYPEVESSFWSVELVNLQSNGKQTGRWRFDICVKPHTHTIVWLGRDNTTAYYRRRATSQPMPADVLAERISKVLANSMISDPETHCSSVSNHYSE